MLSQNVAWCCVMLRDVHANSFGHHIPCDFFHWNCMKWIHFPMGLTLYSDWISDSITLSKICASSIGDFCTVSGVAHLWIMQLVMTDSNQDRVYSSKNYFIGNHLKVQHHISNHTLWHQNGYKLLERVSVPTQAITFHDLVMWWFSLWNPKLAAVSPLLHSYINWSRFTNIVLHSEALWRTVYDIMPSILQYQ